MTRMTRKFTPLTFAMSLSLLAHGVGVGVYYAIQHEVNSTRVEFNHDQASEIEVISEPENRGANVPAPATTGRADCRKFYRPTTAARAAPSSWDRPVQRVVCGEYAGSGWRRAEFGD